MKTIYALLLIISLQGSAQDYARQAVMTTGNEAASNVSREFEVMVKKNNFYEPGDLTNIPSLVFSTFKKEYPGAINVSWSLNDKYSTVFCNWENELVIKKYNNDGSAYLTRKTYTIEKLDRPFTDFLKREFDDRYDVNYITEFLVEGSRYYELNMSNAKEWLAVRINRDQSTGVLAITEKKLFNK